MQRLHYSWTSWHRRKDVREILYYLLDHLILIFIIYSLTTNLGSFSGYGLSSIYQVVGGPVSLDLYYSYVVDAYTAIRRIGTDDTFKWMAAIQNGGSGKKMVIDSTEQNLYIWFVDSPLNVVKFQTSDGVIVDAHTL